MAGTSEGARKGWANRKGGGKGKMKGFWMDPKKMKKTPMPPSIAKAGPKSKKAMEWKKKNWIDSSVKGRHVIGKEMAPNGFVPSRRRG